MTGGFSAQVRNPLDMSGRKLPDQLLFPRPRWHWPPTILCNALLETARSLCPSRSHHVRHGTVSVLDFFWSWSLPDRGHQDDTRARVHVHGARPEGRVPNPRMVSATSRLPNSRTHQCLGCKRWALKECGQRAKWTLPPAATPDARTGRLNNTGPESVRCNATPVIQT